MPPKVQSKVGSLANASHKPGGGDKKVFSGKVDYSNVKSRCGTFDKVDHKAGGGNLKTTADNKIANYSGVSKRTDDDNLGHVAGGGNVQIRNQKTDWSKTAEARTDNLRQGHVAGGGNVKIRNESIDYSKVAARTDNLRAGHVAGGGKNKEVFNEPIPNRGGVQARTNHGQIVTHAS